MRRFLGAVVVAGLLSVAPAFAHHGGESFHRGSLVVNHLWAHENVRVAHANAVYLTITNEGTEPDRLIAIEGDFFTSAELQAPVLDEDGALKTASLTAIEIAPGQSLTFQPGGVQILLVGLQQTFLKGDHFHLVLVFEKAGRLEVEVEVEGRDHDHHHSDALGS